jgi:transcriptional regulator with XRE-family HTH domain
MSDLHHCLATNLKALRQRWGFSQAELAEKGGLSVGYMSELENADKWPSPAVLEKLADALQVRPFQLFLEPVDALSYSEWLERKDQIAELGEKLFGYFEKRKP